MICLTCQEQILLKDIQERPRSNERKKSITSNNKHISIWLFYSDVNECELNMTDPRRHNCEHECIDVAGGYACKCRSGYRFHADLRSCRGELVQVFKSGNRLTRPRKERTQRPCICAPLGCSVHQNVCTTQPREKSGVYTNM